MAHQQVSPGPCALRVPREAAEDPETLLKSPLISPTLALSLYIIHVFTVGGSTWFCTVLSCWSSSHPPLSLPILLLPRELFPVSFLCPPLSGTHDLAWPCLRALQDRP
jgi:hypothetical protein